MSAPEMTRKGLLGPSLLGKKGPPRKKERVMIAERRKNVVLGLVALFVLAFSNSALAVDGDTFTNLAEITARTSPGNSTDKPSPLSSRTLTGLSIQGANSVNENSTSSYAATASYSDGSSKNVNAAWSANSPYATINTGGVLSAQEVTANQPVTITASYLEGAVTKAATKGLTIVDGTPVQGQLLFRDDFSEVTASGSPNWDIVTGDWSGKGGRFSSTIKDDNVALVRNVPALDSFEAGRIESNVKLTNKPGSGKPNASILFGYVDAAHYRYVRIRPNRVIIGQVGDYEGETAGVRAVINADIALKTWHSVRVDIYSRGSVDVYIEPSAGNQSGTSSPLLSYLFSGAATGRVGYAAKKARTFFDDFHAWDETALP